MASGGLRDETISARDLLSEVTTSDGAVVTFEGRVRDRNQGRPVARLHYDSYRSMAEIIVPIEIARMSGRPDPQSRNR